MQKDSKTAADKTAQVDERFRHVGEGVVGINGGGGAMAEYWLGRAKTKQKKTCDAARRQNGQSEHLEREEIDTYLQQ